MRFSSFASVILICTLGGLAPCAASAPDRAGDAYKRAEAVLPQHIEELIPNIVIEPHWIGERGLFWIKRQSDDDDQYLLVDPAARATTSLFDPAALADKLSRALTRKITARSLDLADVKVDDQVRIMTFKADRKKWRYDLQTAALSADKEEKEPGVKSPDGKKSAFIRAFNIWIRDLQSGDERALTRDGSAEQPYGRPLISPEVMVEQKTDQPAIPPALAWSPDSRKIATYRMDLRGIDLLTMQQSSPEGELYPRFYRYYYPFAANPTLPTTKNLIVDVENDRLTWSEAPPQPCLYYGGPKFEWSSDGRRVYARVIKRGFRQINTEATDTDTGKVSTLFADSDPSYVSYYGQSWWYDKVHDTTFVTSEKTGYFQIYAVAAGRAVRPLTAGRWRVGHIEGLSADKKSLLFTASGREAGRNPYLRSLYRVNVRGGAITALTPEALDHKVSLSPNGAYVVDNMSLIDVPTQTVLRDATTGAILMRLGQANLTRYLAAGYRLPEPVSTVAADKKTMLYGAIFKPADFNPAVRYPVIENIYTGPHTSSAPKSFEDAMLGMNLNSMSQLGAIGIIIDARGTAGRSHAFQSSAYQNLYAVGLEDHVAAIRQLALRYDWLDADRVGIYGYSAGGYDVIRAMEQYPAFYKVGVAADGDYDNRLDKAIWNEQWLGSRIDTSYAEASTLPHVDKITGKLLLGVGEIDDNVPIAETFRLIKSLNDADKDYSFVLIPNGFHSPDRSPYFQRRRWDFFTENLLGKATPSEFRMRPFRDDEE